MSLINYCINYYQNKKIPILDQDLFTQLLNINNNLISNKNINSEYYILELKKSNILIKQLNDYYIEETNNFKKNIEELKITHLKELEDNDYKTFIIDNFNNENNYLKECVNKLTEETNYLKECVNKLTEENNDFKSHNNKNLNEIYELNKENEINKQTITSLNKEIIKNKIDYIYENNYLKKCINKNLNKINKLNKINEINEINIKNEINKIIVLVNEEIIKNRIDHIYEIKKLNNEIEKLTKEKLIIFMKIII